MPIMTARLDNVRRILITRHRLKGAMIPHLVQQTKAQPTALGVNLRLTGHNYIGTQHLLLALLELEDGAGPLHRSGVDMDRVEADLIAALESLTSGKGVSPGATQDG
jgi:ATP-dependent Clp protease ATP-binding subunit ClpA